MARLCCLAGLLVAGILLPIRGEDRPTAGAAKETPAKDSPAKQSSTQAATSQKADGAVQGASSAEKLTAKGEIPLWPCEKKLIELTNAERRRYGLAELTIDEDLLTST